jgi:hypothetical protein
MKRLTRWIPVLALGTALLTTGACGKSDSDAAAEGEGAHSDAPAAGESDAEAPDDEAPKAEAAKEEGEAGAKATPEVAKPKGEESAEVAKLKEMGPEEQAAVTKRCGDAFDNTVNIMQTAGAPANIVAQMRQQREKTTASCLEQAKIDPSGGRMIDCMIAARLPADIQTCTRKFGNIKPLKPPAGVGAGHGGH